MEKWCARKSINDMTDELNAMEKMRQVCIECFHEIQSPLTSIKDLLERYKITIFPRKESITLPLKRKRRDYLN